MVGFIDDHRGRYRVEPICRVLPVAPSTCCLYKAREADPEKRPARSRRDEGLRGEGGLKKVQQVLRHRRHTTTEIDVEGNCTDTREAMRLLELGNGEAVSGDLSEKTPRKPPQ